MEHGSDKSVPGDKKIQISPELAALLREWINPRAGYLTFNLGAWKDRKLLKKNLNSYIENHLNITES